MTPGRWRWPGGRRSGPTGWGARAGGRVSVLRPGRGGPPPVGGDDAGAVAVARREVERANRMWGACGLSFGPPRELEVQVVDPPRPHLLALGCDHGLPAGGGVV